MYETTCISGPNLSDLQLDWLKKLSKGAWNTDAVALIAAVLQDLLKGHKKVTFDEDTMSVEELAKIGKGLIMQSRDQ
jgi:hypothetical protein